MKIFSFYFLLVVFLLSLTSCGSGSSSVAAENAKPILILVEENGARYLLDEEGVIYSYLIPPHVKSDFTNGSFFIYPNIEYGPVEHYDGFAISCSGHPRSGIEPKYFEVGPSGGSFTPPGGSYCNCAFRGFIVDGAGTLFETELTALFYQK